MGCGAPEGLPELAALHRALVWENVQMKPAPTAASIAQAASTSVPEFATTPAATPAPVINERVSDEALLGETPGGSMGPTPAPVLAEGDAEAATTPTPVVEAKKDEEDEPALVGLVAVAVAADVEEEWEAGEVAVEIDTAV